MISHSTTLEELRNLPHFDRLRRGYFDKIPTNLGLIGFTLSIHLFSVRNSSIAFGVGVACYLIGLFFHEKFIGRDDAELQLVAKNEKSKKPKG